MYVHACNPVTVVNRKKAMTLRISSKKLCVSFLVFAGIPKDFFLLTSLTPSGLAIGAVVLGCATFAVAADVAPPLLLPVGGGGRAGGGVPVLPGPQDSIIVGEPHVSGLRNIEDSSIRWIAHVELDRPLRDTKNIFSKENISCRFNRCNNYQRYTVAYESICTSTIEDFI